MIESGSLTPGIDPAAFGLPAGTALRYEAPDSALRPLLPSYAMLDSDPAVWKGPDSWILPGWAQIWIVLADAPVTVAVRRRPEPLGAAMVFGGTGRAMPVTSRGGVSVVIDVSPMGWARLFGAPAQEWRDRIAPADQLLPAAWVDELIWLVHGCDRADGLKERLDSFFRVRLPPPPADEAIIARIDGSLREQERADSAAVADRLGLTPRALLGLSKRHFAYGPKLLMRRTRFLRALTAMLIAPGPPDFSVAPPGYHDVPHFLRDGNLFLGMTPRRFLALPMPYLRAVLRAREMVLGAPLPMLDRL